MAMFDMKNYLGEEEKKEKQPTKPESKEKNGEEIGEEKKEIQIVSIKGEGAASLLVSQTLREVLEYDGVVLVDRNDEASDIFKNVKFVTSDDVEKDLGKATRFARESNEPLILALSANPSISEKVFLNNIEGRENVYPSFESYYEPIREEIRLDRKANGFFVKPEDLKAGVSVEHYGKVVFSNDTVTLFEEDGSHKQYININKK